MAKKKPPEPAADTGPASLVAERLKIEEWMAAESKRFGDFLAPHKARVEEINNQVLAWLNTNKLDKFTCEAGTAYRSTLLNLKVEDREKLLDFCNENWDGVGNELLMVSAQKDAVKNWMDEHQGAPPPGVGISFFTRLNIRKG